MDRCPRYFTDPNRYFPFDVGSERMVYMMSPRYSYIIEPDNSIFNPMEKDDQ